MSRFSVFEKYLKKNIRQIETVFTNQANLQTFLINVEKSSWNWSGLTNLTNFFLLFCFCVFEQNWNLFRQIDKLFNFNVFEKFYFVLLNNNSSNFTNFFFLFLCFHVLKQNWKIIRQIDKLFNFDDFWEKMFVILNNNSSTFPNFFSIFMFSRFFNKIEKLFVKLKRALNHTNSRTFC